MMTQPMTQQTPFAPEQQFETHQQMNRFEKLEFLQHTVTRDQSGSELLHDMIGWMSEDDFNEFYDYYCQLHDICRDYNELNTKYGE